MIESAITLYQLKTYLAQKVGQFRIDRVSAKGGSAFGMTILPIFFPLTVG